MRAAFVACALTIALAGCVVAHDSGNPPPPEQPVTVVVDTGQVLHAKGGDGVGIFVEYAAGGHWHVWWACDTNLSGLPCDFDVRASGKAIASATTSGFAASDALDAASPDLLVATTHTTDGIASLQFDAQPGADMKVDATMSGLRDGKFFFFVQNGVVRGNFPGNLTDPLIFEPAAP